jgi:VWFA-related protein
LATQFAQTPPAPPPQVFRATTDLVPVDVRVLDKNGKPIEGLTEADFTILEDGVRQPIRHFSVQTFTALTAGGPPAREAAAPAPSPAPAAASPIPRQQRRVLLFVLGRGNLQRDMGGVDGVLHFVRERAKPNDLVAVLAWNRATEFTTDRARLIEVLENFKRDHGRIESLIAFRQEGPAAFYGAPLSPSIQAQIDAVFGLPRAGDVRTMATDLGPHAERSQDDIARQRQLQLEALPTMDPKDMDDAHRALDAFTAASMLLMNDISSTYAGIEYLRRLSGEKHLVFVSANGFTLNRLEEAEDIALAASDARVAFDYFHAQGTTLSKIGQQGSIDASRNRMGQWAIPVGRGSYADIAEAWRTENAQMMSEMTGGEAFIHQFKNVAAAMDRFDESTHADYLLGYYPANPHMDGKYRHIEVLMNSSRADVRGATVEYRHGYFARAAAAPPDIKRIMTFSRVAAAANYPSQITDIKLTATAALARDKGGVLVEMTIDPSRLTLTKHEGRNVGTIEVATFLIDARDRTLGQVWKTIDISLTDADLLVVKRDGAKVRMLATVSGVPKKAKVIVYDTAADLAGSATLDVR